MNAWALIRRGRLVEYPLTDTKPTLHAPAVFSTRESARHFASPEADMLVVPCRITLPMPLPMPKRRAHT